MNIQTEHIEDSHIARLTIEVEPERVQKAFEATARRLSQRANIPGFRKGKAPFQVIVRYFGMQGLLEESIEPLADSVYKAALDETKIRPYAMGELDDIKAEPQTENGDSAIPKLTLVFNVPKQPEVDLYNYRLLRLEYEVPEATDEQVDRALRSVQEGRALIEPSTRPVQVGDKVKLKIEGSLQRKRLDYDLSDEEIEGDKPIEAKVEEDPIDEEHESILRVGEDDEVMPGVTEQLVGMADGETREFTIEYGEDSPFEEWANHTAKLKVTVTEVRNVTLPLLNDELASTVSEGKQPTLLEFRQKVRADIQAELRRLADNQYAEQILELLTDSADMAYPDAMVGEYIDDIVRELENNLRESGMSLDQFMAIEKTDMAQLRQNYTDLAMRRVERSLALGKLVEMEKLSLSDADVDAAIDKMVENLGDQAATFKKLFDNPQSRTNIALDLIKEMALIRLAAIFKGEELPAIPTNPLEIVMPDDASPVIDAAAAPLMIESVAETAVTDQPTTSPE